MALSIKKKSKGIALIKKSNQLIEARYKFDVWEMRFFLSVLSNIRKEDTGFEVYRIWYKDVISLFGLKSNQSYELLRQAAKGLMQKSFFVNYESEGAQREVQYHILRKIDYLKEGEESRAMESQEYVDVTVEPEMKPFLLELQRNFTAYDLRHVRKLGPYPIRIYELMKQYESIGHRTLKVSEIKRILELTTEYPRFSNFYQKIIIPAVNSINRHTDILIADIIQLKEGRSVEALKFTIRSKATMPVEPEVILSKKTTFLPILVVENPISIEEIDRLFSLFEADVVRTLGVSPTVFLEEIRQNPDETQIALALRITQTAVRERNIKNPSGFFIEALRKKYTDAHEEKKRKSVKIESLKTEIKQMMREIEQWQTRGTEHINQIIRDLTVREPGLANLAIEHFHDNPITKTYIINKEKILGRSLLMDDFRQDPTMREWVKLKIIELRRDAFEPKITEIEQILLKLNAQIEELKIA